MGTPSVFGFLCGVIIGEIMTGNLGIKSAAQIALVFKLQCFGVVLAVTCNVEESALFGSYDVDTCLIGFSKDVKLSGCFDVLTSDLGMAGMGSGELLIEAAKEGMTGKEVVMLEHAGHLLAEGVFLDIVVVEETCLSRPTDMEGGIDIFL